MKTLLTAIFFPAVLIVTIMVVGSCGNDAEEKVIERDPPPLPVPGPVTGFGEVQKILEESCGFNGCHANAGFIRTESGLRASSAKVRILNSSMPPSYASNFELWKDGTRKKTILDFLNRGQ